MYYNRQQPFQNQDLLSILAFVNGGQPRQQPMGQGLPMMLADAGRTTRPSGAGAVEQLQGMEGMADLVQSIRGVPSAQAQPINNAPSQASNRSVEDQLYFMQHGVWPPQDLRGR